MKIELVNGYPCRDCADVSLAKRGLDPAAPRGPDGLPQAERPDPRDSVNRPLPEGERGTRLNVMA